MGAMAAVDVVDAAAHNRKSTAEKMHEDDARRKRASMRSEKFKRLS